MKKAVLFIGACACLVPEFGVCETKKAVASAPEIKPAQFVINTTEVEKRSLGFGTVAFAKPGYYVTYLVSGDGVLGIDADSLEIAHITDRNGKDISTESKGNAAYSVKPDFVPMRGVENCAFTIAVSAENASPETFPSIKGTIDVKIAGDEKTQEATFDKNKAETKQAGPFSVTFKKPSGKKRTATSGTGNMFGDFFFDANSGYGITVKSDTATAASVKIGSGKSELSTVETAHTGITTSEFQMTTSGPGTTRTTHFSSGGSGGNSVTYSFPEPESDEFTVVITYFDGTTRKTVSFGE